MIGERIREYRTSKNIKVVDFANIIRISQGSLSGIETGKSKPSADTIAALLQNTDIDPYWLMLGEKRDIPQPISSEEKRVIKYGRRKTDLPMSKQCRRAVEGLLYLEETDQDGFTMLCGKIIEREEKIKGIEEVKKIGNIDS